MSRPLKYTKERVLAAAQGAASRSEVCRNLGVRPAGGHYRRVKKVLDEAGIDLRVKGRPNGKLKLADVLVKGDRVLSPGHKKRLFTEGILEHKCDRCGLEEWLGEWIRIQVDHINGDPTDNRVENLRPLCPNCHSQTDTFCGRNIRKSA